MIVAKRKPLNVIIDMISGCERILIVGCKGCVTVCNTGGKKEVEILASILKISRQKEGKNLYVDEVTLMRALEGRQEI